MAGSEYSAKCLTLTPTPYQPHTNPYLSHHPKQHHPQLKIQAEKEEKAIAEYNKALAEKRKEDEGIAGREAAAKKKVWAGL